MITSLRTTLKGPVLRVIMATVILFIALAMILPRIFEPAHSDASTDWMMQVNDSRISPATYNRALAQLQAQKAQMLARLKKEYGDMAEQLLSFYGLGGNLDKLARHSTITSEVLGQVARKLSLDLPEDMVFEQIIKQLPPEVIGADGQINLRALQRVLPYGTIEEFQEDVKNRMETSQVLDLVEAGVYVPEFVLKNNYMQQYASKDFGVALFPLSNFLAQAKKNQVTAKELAAFYAKENKASKRYWIPEKRIVTTWKFTPAQYNVKVSQKEVERYYNTNKRQKFLENPTQVQVRRIRLPFDKTNPSESRKAASDLHETLAKDPSQFARLVKEKSIDTEYVKVGGLLPWIARGEVNEKLEKAIFALKDNNDLSPIMLSDDGLEIYQRAGKKKLAYKPLKAVEGEIKESLRNEKFKKSFDISKRRVINQYRYGDIPALAAFVADKHGTKEVQTVIKSDPSVTAQKGFEIKRAKGLIGYMQGSEGFIEQLDRVEKSKADALEAIKSRVETDFYQDRALELQKKAMQEVRSKSAKVPLSQAAKAAGVTYKATGWVNSDDKEKIEALQKDNIPVQGLMNLTQKGLIGENVTGDMGYLMTLLDVEPFDQQKFDAKRLEMNQSVREQQENLLKQAFIASLLQNATIKVNKKLINY